MLRGNYYWVTDSKLYTKPAKPIPLYISGLGEQSAKLAGEEAEGFVTNELDIEIIRNKLFPALAEGAESLAKIMSPWIKYCLFQRHIAKIREGLSNLLDFGEVR